MALLRLASGYEELRWPRSFDEWDDFVVGWGLTERAAILALALGHYTAQLLGVRLWMISGRRDESEQAALWDRRAGSRFPVAAPGTSRHQQGTAFDVGADYALSSRQWAVIGDIGRRLGLRWGGDFTTFDGPHFDLG